MKQMWNGTKWVKVPTAEMSAFIAARKRATMGDREWARESVENCFLQVFGSAILLFVILYLL